MKKEQWFSELDRILSVLTFDERKKAKDYYEELYADKLDAGYSEEQILAEFGSPYSAAESVIAEFRQENPNYVFPEYNNKTGYAETNIIEKQPPKSKTDLSWLVSLAFAIPTVVLYIISISLAIGLYSAVVGIFISAIVAFLVPFFSIGTIGTTPVLIGVGVGLILLGIGIAFCVAVSLAMKYLFEGLRQLQKFVRNSAKGE